MEAIYLCKVIAHFLSPQQPKHTHTHVTDERVRPRGTSGRGKSLVFPALSMSEAHKCRKWKGIS